MKEDLRLALSYSHMGFVMVLIIGFFTYLGYTIGQWLERFSLGLGVGLIVGILGALAYFLFKTRKLISNEVDKRETPPGK